MKKAITIYIDDCAESIEEVCATFVLHKPTGATSVHMININWKDKNKVYLPWKGDAVIWEGGRDMSVTKTETGVQFNITNTDLIESISLLTNLRDFCKEQEQDGKQETIKALTTAIETMEAFWCEKFGEDETDEVH